MNLFTPADDIKTVEQDGIFVQIPEGHKNGDDRNAAQDGGRGEDLVGVVVVQIVYRRKPKHKSPDALHGGQKCPVGQCFVKDDGGQDRRRAAMLQGAGRIPDARIRPVGPSERFERMMQCGFTSRGNSS